MSNFPDLKLYRKFLILAVMLAGIFVVSSARHAAAGTTCCDDCFSAWSSCMDFCHSDQIKDWMVPACETSCYSDYANCAHSCGIPVCPSLP